MADCQPGVFVLINQSRTSHRGRSDHRNDRRSNRRSRAHSGHRSRGSSALHRTQQKDFVKAKNEFLVVNRILYTETEKPFYTTGFFTSGKHGGIVASETRAMPGKEKRNDPQTILRYVQIRISGSFTVQLQSRDAWSFGMPI